MNGHGPDPNIVPIESLLYRCSYQMPNGVTCNDHATTGVESPNRYLKYRCERHKGLLNEVAYGAVKTHGLRRMKLN